MSTTHVDEIVDAELVEDDATPPETPPPAASTWRREFINGVLAAIGAFVVLGLGWGGSQLLASTRGTGAGWAMTLVILGVATVVVAVGPLARRRMAGPATAVTVTGVILGAVGAWLASQVSWSDLVTAAIGLLLLLLAAGVVYLYGRYLYQP